MRDLKRPTSRGVNDALALQFPEQRYRPALFMSGNYIRTRISEPMGDGPANARGAADNYSNFVIQFQARIGH